MPCVILIGTNATKLRHLKTEMPELDFAEMSAHWVTCRDVVALPIVSKNPIFVLDIEQQPGEVVPSPAHRLKQSYTGCAILALMASEDPDMETRALESGVDDILLATASAKRVALSLRNLRDLAASRQNSGCCEIHQPHPDYVALRNSSGSVRRLREIEQEVIEYAMQLCDGSMKETAASLGIGRSTLYRRLDSMRARIDFQKRVSEIRVVTP